MANYGKLSGSLSKKVPTATAQTVQTPGTVMNNAGGYVYELDMWERLDRFLIMGADGPTYYCSEQKMVLDNAKNVVACIKADGVRVVDRIVELSDSGRAAKNDPALFALALCHSHGDLATKLAVTANLPKVARIGTHLFQFAHFRDTLGGWGSGLRKTIAKWYNSKDAADLAFQVVKYPQRTVVEANTKDGVKGIAWSHDDLLRKCHPKGDALHQHIYHYIAKDGALPEQVPSALRILDGANKIKAAKDEKSIVALINEYKLPHELVPKEFANKAGVWKALLPHMPIGATLRSLNRLTSYGVLPPLSDELKMVVARLTNLEAIKKGRVHPLNVYSAIKTYGQGHGVKGDLSWTPIPQVRDALEELFYLAFQAVEPTGKNILLGLDISGSMGGGAVIGNPLMTPREASAIMAMVTARSEKNHHFIGFTSSGWSYGGGYGVTDIDISPKDKINAVIEKMSRLPMGGTDCALPIMYALHKGLNVDAFITYTDSETYAGSIKPHEALMKYRREKNPGAKLIAVGLTATEYSIADPNDAGSMNFSGFDSSAPALMAEFIRKPLLRTR